jgi:hypothetical protein
VADLLKLVVLTLVIKSTYYLLIICHIGCYKLYIINNIIPNRCRITFDFVEYVLKSKMVKSQVVLVQAMKANKCSIGIAQLILRLCARWR